MGLRATIESAVDRAWAATDDIPLSATYRRYTGSTHNPITGVITPTYDDHAVTPIEQALTTFQLSLPEVEWTDKIYLIRGNELTGVTELGPSGDLLVFDMGGPGEKIYNVQNAVSTQGIVWEVQVRAP